MTIWFKNKISGQVFDADERSAAEYRKDRTLEEIPDPTVKGTKDSGDAE